MPQRERPLCEGCGVKTATFGTPTERERRWCGGCGKAQGAISLAAKMCHGCGAKEATFEVGAAARGQAIKREEREAQHLVTEPVGIPVWNK